MKYKIFRNQNLVAEVAPQGEVTERLFGEETVTMDFSLSQFVKFHIGDSVAVYGKNYYISAEPSAEKISSREFKYQLIFNSIKYRLAEVQYFFYDEENQLTMPEFSIMGTARRMVELIVANANRVQSGWKIGTIDDTETKLVDFSGYNCLAALTRISDEFGVEFWVDTDKSIHLTERKAASGYTFAYGKGKGLKSINRMPYTEASLVTRLYAKGSEQNLPKTYRNGQKALRMNVPFLEKNTDKFGIIEHTHTFEDVYPKRVGTVTAINPNNPMEFTDSTLDFDLNAYNEYGTTVLIAGTSAKVIFQTGDLAGYTLEVKEYGFNSATKTFTLLKNKDEKSFEIPSANFRPKVGDKYILVDIMMPQSYVTAAEAELKTKAQEYLDKNSVQRFIYTMETDPIYFKNMNVNLKLGQTVRFKDTDFNLDADIRIISLTKDLQNPFIISFEIAEQATITQIVRNYIEQEKKETAIKKDQKNNAEMARRSWLFAEELKNNVFDNEGYFDTEKIKPLSVETQHISVGSRSQQFSLPNIALTLSPNQRRLRNTAGQMVHLTIAQNPRTWQVPQNETADFSTNFNFIYLKADKNGTNASFVVTEQRLMLDADPIFYYFMVGSVSSVIDGVRRIKTNYGFTQISPNEISTGRISSANGANWIDLLQDRIEINANVTFAADSPALGQVQGIVDNISVGGRNLISKPEIIHGFAIRPIITTPLVVGEEYVISFEIKGQNNGHLFLNNAITFTDIPLNPSPNEWFRISKVFVFRKSDYLGKEIFPHIYGATEVRNIKLEKGNKATDWTPAPEDVEQAARAYADAQDALRKVEANAYADGIVDTEEQRAIADATAKMEAAKAHAQALMDSVEVGGRNLLLLSNFKSVPNYNNGIADVVRVSEYEGELLHSNSAILITPTNGNDNYSNLFFYTRLEPNTDYTFSYWGKSAGEITGSSSYIFLGSKLLSMPVPTPYHLYQKISITFRTDNTNLDFKVRFGFARSNNAPAWLLVNVAKLEKGNKATDWTPAPEDVEAQITTAQNTANQALGLTQAQSANVTALQQKTNFLSSTAISGNAVATGTLIVGNGLGANAGITGLGGDNDIFLWGGADYQGRNNAPISMHRDGFLRVRNAQGSVIFEIGQQNGDAVFNIYNNDGVKVAGIGQRGIEFTGYIPESFDEKKLLRLDLVNFNDNQSLISAINTIYGTQMNGIEGINGETYYRISFTTNATGYSYNAGRNFESAGNLQYEQYFFASKNKFGDKVANGIYALKAFTIASNEANGGMYELSVTIYEVQDGKIIRSKVVNKTGYVNNIIID